MAEICFYEKPGCINNTKQKKLLSAAGHDVDARNLLTHAWSADELKRYFSGKSIAECFNRSNPKVKSGEISPETLNEARALEMMVAEPLLIRRPLMKIGKHFFVGFDVDKLQEIISLASVDASDDLESCPRSHSDESCDKP